MKVQHLGANKYFPLVSCISNLFASWHSLLQSQSIVHGYLLSTYSCGIRILSAMGIWSQALFRTTITGVVVLGFRSSSVAVAHDGYLVESRRPLWFGSPQANRCLYKYTEHSPLPVAVSCSTLIISLRLASRASLSSPFSSPCYIIWSPLFSRSVLLVLSLEQQWTNMQHGNISSRTNGAGCIYTEYVCTKHIYIQDLKKTLKM